MKLRRSVSLLLAIVISLSIFPTTVHATESDMVDVLLADTADYYIVVSIPADKAEEYQLRIKTDPAFKNQEIQFALKDFSPQNRSFLDGRVLFESFMYLSDIEDAVDAWSGIGTFVNFLGDCAGVVPYEEILTLVKLSGYGTAAALSANILCIALSIAADYQESWWKQAAVDIVNGVISAVRYRIIENDTEYPKVWRVFDRI